MELSWNSVMAVVLWHFWSFPCLLSNNSHVPHYNSSSFSSLGESLADASLDPFGFLGASNGFFYYPERFKPSFKHIMTQNDRQHLAPNTTTSSTSLLRIKTSIWLIQNLITNILTMTFISLLWMSKILFMLPCLSSLLVRLWVRLCHYKRKYLNVQCTDKLLVR